jgi:hypothetical protein
MLKPFQAIFLIFAIAAVILAVRLNMVDEDATLEQPEQDQESGFEATVQSEAATSVVVPVFDSDAVEPVNPSAWVETDQAPTELPTYRADLSEQGFLELNRPMLESVEIDQVLKLWLPQEKQTLEISIYGKEVTGSGNTVIKGFLDGDESYPFVMTLGRTSTFATISTRNAVYSLQGDVSMAWIASSAVLKEQSQRHGQDYVVPKA